MDGDETNDSILVTPRMVIGVMTFAPRAFAYMLATSRGDELNSGNLVQVLTLTDPRPRGVSLRPPKCSHLRQQVEASQGIALIAKADTASRLTQGFEKILDTLGLAFNSAMLKPCCFEIKGYTDATGGAGYNQQLSKARANSVIDYLQSAKPVAKAGEAASSTASAPSLGNEG